MIDLALRTLRRQWLWMALFFVAVSGAVAVVTLLMPKTYASEAKLLVRLGRENATLDPTSTLGSSVVAIPPSREMDIGSVIEIVRSKVLLEEVVAAVGPEAILGAGDTRTDQAVRTLASNLTAEAVKKSNIVQIHFEGPSPEAAQAVVAALVERATERHIHLHRNPRAHTFLVERVERLRTDLTQREKKLAELKAELGLFAPEAERQAAVARLGRTRDELLQAQASAAATRQEAERLRQQIAGLTPTQTTARTTGSGVVANDVLRTQLHTLQTREQELLARYSDRHPEVELLRKQIAAARDQLAQDEKANPREQVVVGPNRIYEDLRLALLQKEHQLAGLEARAEHLTAQVDREQAALGRLEGDALRLTQEQREVDLLTAGYRKYAENLDQTQLDRALEDEKISNLSVAQPATFDPLPVRPRLSFNLAVGIVFALAGALALGGLLETSHSPQVSPVDTESSPT